HQVVPATRDAELRAPVPRPGGLVARGVQRPGLAEALRLEARRVEAEAHQVILHRVRAPQAQRDVVLDRPALVRVAIDRQRHAGIRAQHPHLALERRLRVRPDVRTIEVEVDHLRKDVARLGRRPARLLLRTAPLFLRTAPLFLRTTPLFLRAARGLVIHLLRRLRRRLTSRAPSERYRRDHDRQDQTPQLHRVSSLSWGLRTGLPQRPTIANSAARRSVGDQSGTFAPASDITRRSRPVKVSTTYSPCPLAR